MHTVFNGLLAEIPAILDSFFHQYHKYTFYRGGGWGLGMATGTQKLYSDAGGRKYGPIELEIPQKVAKSMANITVESCGQSQPLMPLFWPATGL